LVCSGLPDLVDISIAPCSFLTSDLLDFFSSKFSGTSVVFDDDFLLMFGRIGCCLQACLPHFLVLIESFLSPQNPDSPEEKMTMMQKLFLS
jgi:hypothetical protein